MRRLSRFIEKVQNEGIFQASTSSVHWLLEHDLQGVGIYAAYLHPRKLTAVVDDNRFELLGDWRPGGGIGKDFVRNGCHEPVTSREILSGLTDSGAVFYDVGAASGYFSVLAAQQTASEHIHAFEPSRLFPLLKKNAQEFAPNATVKRSFVGDSQDGVILDDFAERIEDPDVVKIDVDGGEDGVLRGMVNVIAQAQPKILLEVHVEGDYQTRREVIQTVFDGADYRFEVCTHHRDFDGDIVPVDLSNLPNTDEFNRDYLLICRPM